MDKEKQMWKEYMSSRSLELRNQLVCYYIPLALKRARAIWGQLPSQVLLSEVQSAAFVGLIDAVSKYDNQTTKFTTYGANRIRGAILDWLRSIDTQPRSLRKYKKRLETMVKDGPMTDQDLADACGVSLDKHYEMQEHMQVGDAIPFMQCGDNMLLSMHDRSVSDPSSRMARRMEKDRLFERLFENLDERTREVLYLIFYEGVAPIKIAADMKRTTTRICQIRNEGLRQIREGLIKQNKLRLECFLECA